MSEYPKVKQEIRKHWRICCEPNAQVYSGVSQRGINRILDDVEALEAQLAVAENRAAHLEDSRFALAVAHTEDSLTIERLEGRVAELEAECNQLGQGQILLADEVAELEAENARLKAVEQKIQFFCSAEGHSPCLALLATYATAKEQK
jgi:hypothetical protein